MTGEWILTVAPVVGLVANVSTQLVSVRILRGKLAAPIIAGLVCGMAATFALIGLGLAQMSPSRIEGADAWCVAILTYLALAYGFFVFLNLNVTSLRIRMLREMLRADGRMDMNTLLHQYTPEERLRRRLERLQSGGQIRLEVGRWRLKSSPLLAVARGMEGARILILPARYRGG